MSVMGKGFMSNGKGAVSLSWEKGYESVMGKGFMSLSRAKSL